MGLRPQHYPHILQHRPNLDWFEAVSENYIGLKDQNGGNPIRTLEKIRKDYPIVLHGISLSLGGTEPFDKTYLQKLKALYQRIEPAWVSDHLCWTGFNNQNLHDLLPVPFTEETLIHLISRVRQIQDFFNRQIAVENVSSYFTFSHSTISEWEFLKELSDRADCLILLDINNIYVSSVNHRFDPIEYIDSIPINRVAQFHLAGHSNNGDHLIDTHDHRVARPVWKLYQHAVERFGNVPTLLEWDDRIPKFAVLEKELDKARKLQETVFATSTSRSPKVARVETHAFA